MEIHELVWLFLAILLVSCAISGYAIWSMGQVWFWKRAIDRFEESDRVRPPQPGVIVFTGSSSVRFWKTLAQDMAPLNVINRGFGGSQMAHVTYYATKIVLPYSPSAIVVYAGENDLSWPWHKAPETVLNDFQKFVDLVHAQLPSTWIYFISIKPTPRRWKQRLKQRHANQIIEDFCRTKPNLQFIDVSAAMLNASGKPRRDLFRWDGLHPSARCYILWRSIMQPILLEQFANLPSGTPLGPYLGSKLGTDQTKP
ncbi:MAG: hypothetical protein JOY62_08045 [Acidobacteriaceae bacterium]|nr:hypothetical protein [Acidobacteriaceae bacterium]MBV9779911.1 hypothetical protein [Acidobacteriaceae bacterium]